MGREGRRPELRPIPEGRAKTHRGRRPRSLGARAEGPSFDPSRKAEQRPTEAEGRGVRGEGRRPELKTHPKTNREGRRPEPRPIPGGRQRLTEAEGRGVWGRGPQARSNEKAGQILMFLAAREARPKAVRLSNGQSKI
uniref:Uncharacterized protein n=1 Tax=Meloidogyne enterolobii TaxID=390850 RepID=A0A6V7Y270_MELEN|nr:unnamed protein product [Meloidogyne enterolobii]